MDKLERLLEQGLQQMQLTLTADQKRQLLEYLALLHKWNRAFNLTAVREAEQMVSRHLLDSLSVLPWIRGPRLIDVGSGPGLPGIPLAICRPDLQVTTLDSNGKKTRFQQQVKAALKLDNLTVIHGRVESCQQAPFDQVISRAFASLNDMLEWTAHLCSETGVFLAMKGLYPAQEVSTLREGFALDACHPLQVPDCEGERHLLIIRRA